MRYEERKNGQILEEGITEAGAMASFIAAGTAYATHGLNMIPFYLFYSMFGFQRIGDLIWAAGDMRCRGFLLGATAGRTTLNGEGLQHQDGHSQLHASTVPNCVSYDPAFAYEMAVIVQDGIRRMYEAGEEHLLLSDPLQREVPDAADAGGGGGGILKGLYKFRPAPRPGKLQRVHLFGSGPLVNEALRAQELLRERYKVAADVWSATSYNELYRDALACQRWNRLHPEEPPRVPYIARALADEPWPVVVASDYVSSVAQRLAPGCPPACASSAPTASAGATHAPHSGGTSRTMQNTSSWPR